MLAHVSRIIGEHKPITADIFLTNYCNNKCPYCTYRRWELEPGARAMPGVEFIKYAMRLVELGVQGIILTGGGEPTLNPDFGMITKWLEDNGIHYGINTNFNKLVYFKPDYLKVSLDGWDENSYRLSRGVQAYGQVCENIIKYDDWRKKYSQNTTLGIQIVAKNPVAVTKFYEANKNLPVDYIAFRPMESTAGKYYKIAFDKDEFCDPVFTIKAIQELAEHDTRVSLSFKWNLLSQRERSCTAEWAQIALNENGDVMYCCHKPYEIVGHIMDYDIMEKKAAFQTDMSMCDIPCRMTAPNMEVARITRPQKDCFFI